MEDDLSHIVGLSLEFWLLTTVVILIAGPFGFPIVIVLPAAGLLMVVANGKLVAVTRAVTAAGRAGRLREDVFWLGRPQLLLVPIKAALFVVSFLFGTLLLYLWQFGPDSCPFTTAFYPGWVLPWWTIPIFTGIILAHLAFCTLPTYALAVLMGSSIKANMLPQRLSKKLLALTDTMRRQMAEEREELARSGGEAPELAAAASAQQARRASELEEHKSSRMERMASVVGRRLVGQHGH
jgi:mlo protein